jgi:hypothetical protein
MYRTVIDRYCLSRASTAISNFSNAVATAMTPQASVRHCPGNVQSNVQRAPIPIATFLPIGRKSQKRKGKCVHITFTDLLTDPRWIYSLFTTINANFRLKNKSRGVLNDPPLGDGWAHWVPESPYKEYLSEYGFQTEVRWLTFNDCMINLCV